MSHDHDHGAHDPIQASEGVSEFEILERAVRELAIELAPLVRVNGVAPATVVQGSAMFPRDRVVGSLAKYNIPYTEDEATESLVKKLAQFYADRTLTKAPITPADQARSFRPWTRAPTQRTWRTACALRVCGSRRTSSLLPSLVTT